MTDKKLKWYEKLRIRSKIDKFNGKTYSNFKEICMLYSQSIDSSIIRCCLSLTDSFFKIRFVYPNEICGNIKINTTN